jgi:hypothetical protein
MTMIDPELKYCPRCNDEYRADIEQCAACEIALVTGTRKLEMEREKKEQLSRRRGKLTAEDELVIIERGSLHDLRRLESLLAAERIGTSMTGDENSCSKSCCPSNFYLQVRKEDAADALQIIAEEHRRTTGLDEIGHDHGQEIFNPAIAEAVCPACGFSFPTSQATCPDCGLCFG